MKRFYLPLIALLFLSFHLNAATLYWIGGTGDWSDISHWNTDPLGLGTAALPVAADDVIFGLSSFTASTETTTLSAPITVASLTYEGIGTFQQNGNLTVTGAIAFFNGVWSSNGFSISCGTFNANSPTDEIRTLDISGTQLTVTGVSCNLTGNTSNFTFTSTALSQIRFTGTADITFSLGGASKTIPNLLFSAIVNNNVTIVSGSTGNVITFGSITKTVAGSGRIDIDQNNTNATHKIFGNFSLPIGCRVRIGYRPGTGNAFGVGVYTQFQGTITHAGLTGGNGAFEIRGRWGEFQQPVSLNSATLSILGATRFQSTYTANSNTSIFFYDGTNTRPVVFNGTVTLSGNTTVNTSGPTTFNGALNISSGSNFNMINDPGLTEPIVFSTVNLATESIASFGTQAAPYTFGTFNVGSESRLTLNPNGATTTINNLNANSFSVIEFNSNPASPTVITGTISITVNCRNWAWFKGSITGSQASVSLTNPHILDGIMVSDLNVTSANLTINSGVDNGNNTGITFGAPSSSLTFYWVGSTTGNTKTRAFSTGINDNWSNPDNWALASGDVTTVNSCLPSSLDHVIFDINSFSGVPAGSVELDLSQVYCNNMTWTGVPTTARLDQVNTGLLRFLYIFGNLTFATPGARNQFEGTIVFTSHNVTPKTITSNGESFGGGVEFDFTNGVWNIADNMDINGGLNGDFTITKGTVTVTTQTIALEGDFIIELGVAPITFNCGTGTLRMDGNTDGVNIFARTVPLYNLTLNKSNANHDVRIRANAITIQNSLTLTQGRLSDSDEGNEGPWQITGNTTGTGILSITNNGTLFIGDNDGPAASLFPIGYSGASVSLTDGSTVNYKARVGDQTVKGNITYGNVTLSNANNTQRNKTLDGPITVTRKIDVNDDITFIDNGFQITGDGSADSEIELDNNDATLVLGTATIATQFPTNMPVIDLDVNTRVIYNSGIAQTIRGLTGVGDASYPNIILRNPTTAMATKTLSAATIIRSSLTIEDDNQLDVSASNFAISIQGNWNCLSGGLFNDQNGTVTFNSTTAAQTVLSGGNPFYNLSVAKSNGIDLTLSDPAVIANSVTFSAGDIVCAAPNTLTFNDNTTYSGAGNTAHANGVVTKIGNDAFDFPIGNGTVIRPCGIATNPVLISDTYSAYYVAADPDGAGYDITLIEPTLEHVSRCEYWMISQDLGSSAVRIKLSWEQTASCDVADPSDLAVAHWTGSLWADEGNSAASPLGLTGTVTSANTISSFSPFTLADKFGGVVNPLPLTLISFKGSIGNNGIQLTWVSLNEKNVSHFVIEKSLDANTFEPLGNLEAMGNTNGYTSYSFTDQNAVAGQAYYRLRIIDHDGSYRYSSIISLESGYFNVQLFPNPATNKELYLTLEESLQEGTTLSIFDLNGQWIYTTPYVNAQTNILENINYLSPGIYSVMISNQRTGQVVKKFAVY